MSVAEDQPTPRRKYGKKARMGTMGILEKDGEILIIHRRYKDREIRMDGRPGKWQDPTLQALPIEANYCVVGPFALTNPWGFKDTWSFPGGGLDEDETPEEAIVREFGEEVGLKVTIRPIGDELVWGEVDDYLDDDLWRCSFFVLDQIDPEQKPEVG